MVQKRAMEFVALGIGYRDACMLHERARINILHEPASIVVQLLF